MTTIEQSILTSLICVGIKITYSEGKIFDFVGNWLIKLYDKGGWYSYIAMPLGACHYCMASVYGILFHVCLVLIGCAGKTALLPAVLLASVFLNGVFYGVLNKLEK